MALLLALVTIALYWPATGCDFVNYDDTDYVTANPRVQAGLSWGGVKWAFLNPVSCNWHPITILSHMVVCQSFGLNPWGHHLANVLVHALNGMLVFVVLRQMTGATWRSLLAAALFAIHPLRVESVAWVSERKDVLGLFFGLLSLVAYARYAQSDSLKSKVQSPKSGFNGACPASIFYLLSLVFLALGLMSKPVLVTWPFVMLLLDYWPLERFAASRAWRLVAEKIPFYALAVASSVVTFWAQQRGGSLAMGQSLSLGSRGGNALVSYCRHLGKLLWPADLAVFYPHPGQWPVGKVLLAGMLILGITILLFGQRRRYSFLLVGWLWFCGTLVPMIGLVQTGDQAMADRHTYVPAIGIIVALVWGLHRLGKGGRYPQIGLWVAGSAILVFWLALTRQQIGYWKNSEALFRHALEVTQKNYLAHFGLGAAFDQNGQPDRAISQYQDALRLKPDYVVAYNNLGIAFLKKGRVDDAISQYQAALRLKPDFAEAHYNLGNALGEKGQVNEAISQYEQALRLKPDYTKAHNNLGLALAAKGQLDEAIRQYQQALRLQPDGADARNNLGIALAGKGQTDEAIHQYQEALRLKPDDAEAHFNLGAALGGQGQTDQAIRQFQEALRLKPDNAEAHYNLGTALRKKGQIDQAIRQYEDALRLKPDYPEARNNLARVMGMKNAPAGR